MLNTRWITRLEDPRQSDQGVRGGGICIRAEYDRESEVGGGEDEGGISYLDGRRAEVMSDTPSIWKPEADVPVALCRVSIQRASDNRGEEE